MMLGTNDLPRAIKFYDPLMALLGHVKAGRNEQGASWGTFNGNHTCGLCVGACPEVFRMSDEDGKAEVYADPVPPEFREDALNAEGACPVSVIEIL